MTTIATFTDAIRADFAAPYLQSRDVAAVLADRDTASYIGASNLVPIRLQVPDNEAEEAMTILKDLDMMASAEGREDSKLDAQ